MTTIDDVMEAAGKFGRTEKERTALRRAVEAYGIEQRMEDEAMYQRTMAKMAGEIKALRASEDRLRSVASMAECVISTEMWRQTEHTGWATHYWSAP